MSDDDFEALETFLPDLLPEGAVPTIGVVLVEFLNSDGETEHSYETLGDVRVINAIGLCEVGKLMLWADAHEEE